MKPIMSYSGWNKRTSDMKEQIEPFRKYIFICEGANTEVYYFKKLIDMRKELAIHSLIDICLWEKTGKDRDISYAKNLVKFAKNQKEKPENNFDIEHDKMIIVFDGDIFEEKVKGYDELISTIEEDDIAAVTNPGFELFLLLHIENSYEKLIQNNENKFLTKDDKDRYSYAFKLLSEITGINAKKNKEIGNFAKNIKIAIKQEKKINQDIHNIKGNVSSNIGKIIEDIIQDKAK